jgi:hypothetical protein
MVVRILFRSSLVAALFIGLLLSISVTADTVGSVRLFTLLPQNTLTLTRSTVGDGMRPIRYHSTELHQLPQGSTVRLSLNESLDISLTHDHTVDNPSGSRTWVGRLTGFPASYRAIITDDGEHVHGRIMTPRGVYWLETSEDGAQWLHNPRASGLQPTPFGDDAMVPPYEVLDSESALPTRELRSLSDPSSTEQATVDVLIAYTPGLVSRLGAGLPARLEQLVAVANQAYTDSGINMRLRLVHTVQVNYSDTLDNNQALSDITPISQHPTPPEVAMLGSLRDQYGADLVALIRPYDRLQDRGCGLAWLLGVGQGQLSIQRDAPYGYAVVSDGTSGQFFCADTTLVHELGHNMGSEHDRATAAATQGSSGGLFDYSYGHGIEGTFGTIMSYIDPEVALFSSPAVSCVPGQPCGVDHTAVNSADNVRSINNVRFQVAAFRDTEIVDPIDPIDSDPTFLLSVTTTGTGSGTVSSSPSGINCGSLCSVEFNQNTAVTLTANPASGSTFAGWSGACSGTSSCAVTMTQNRNITATFNITFNIDADIEVMQQYYLAYYARPADLDGLADWLRLIQAASSERERLEVLDTIRASFGSPSQAEFVGLYGDNVGVDAFFDSAYANILNRTEQDAAARAYWLGTLTDQTQAYQNAGRSMADAEAYARADLLSLLINAALAFPGTRDYDTFTNKQRMAAYATQHITPTTPNDFLEHVKVLLANPEIHTLSEAQLYAAVDELLSSASVATSTSTPAQDAPTWTATTATEELPLLSTALWSDLLRERRHAHR